MRKLGPGALLLLAGCGGEPVEPAPPAIRPSYHADVAPILTRSCVSCHRAGSIAEQLPLDSYEAVRASAIAIMDAVRSRRMPPSVVDVSGECNEFQNPRRLTEDELATILEWGSSHDHPAGEPQTIEAPTIAHLDRVDLHLEMAEPYRPDPSRADDHRCFVLDPELDRDAWVTAYQVLPGEPRSVHHVLLFSLANEQSDGEAIARDRADDRPGYECFGGPGVSDFRFLAGWAPGTGPTRFPEGSGLLLPAGRKAVLQVHYNLSAMGEPDQTAVDLQLSDAVTDEAIVLPLADLELELAPGRSSVETSIEVVLEGEDRYTLLGAFPHMHRLGRTLRVERNDDCLLDVPAWRFEWQEFFFYAQPLEVMPGDRVRMTCTYDTSSRSEAVRWGEGTDDEMCLVGFYVVKASGGS